MEYTDYSGLSAFSGAYSLVILIITIINIIAFWKLFTLAGKPGWAAIIPIYNVYVMLEIAGLQWWWLLILLFGGLIPLLGLLIVLGAGFYVTLKFVQSYGKDVGFAIGAFLLSFIFFPILAFSKDTKYIGPAGQAEVDQLINKVQETSQTTTEEKTTEQQAPSQEENKEE